jgi:hypothetical protein
MNYYTKNGSIPKPETDGTDGWVAAPAPPDTVPEGKQLVWLNWEWIIRDPKPDDRDGYQWNWNHADLAWVECALPSNLGTMPPSEPAPVAPDPYPFSALTTDQMA